VDPLIGFPLHHTKQASVDHLEGIGFEVDQNEEQPIFRRRQGAVFVHGKPTRGPRLAIHPPRRHPGVERSLKGWDQLLKLVERQAREIQKLHRARLQHGKSYTSHGSCLLSWDRDVRGAAYQKESGINSNMSKRSIACARACAVRFVNGNNIFGVSSLHHDALACMACAQGKKKIVSFPGVAFPVFGCVIFSDKWR